MAAEHERPASADEFVISRVFDAPRALVFKAWTTPEHLAQWWGPHPVTNAVCEMDARPGGAYRIVMRMPDGVEYPISGTILELVAPEHLVFTMDVSGHPPAWHDMVNPNRPAGQADAAGEMRTTVTFAEVDGKTAVTVRTRFASAVIRDAMVHMGMQEGWSQSLDRLGAHAASMGRWDIVTSRVFDAPRALVFEAWTNPRHVAQWWGPNGFRSTIHEMDVRPGGVWRFVMHGPDGIDYRNENVFVEVEHPRRLVYDHLTGPRFRTEVTFDDEAAGTRVTMRARFETAADYDVAVMSFGAIEGAMQHIRRMGEHVAGMVAAGLTITRVFDAPRALVFKAWTEAERLAQWWGPKGFTMLVAKLDLRPGGLFHYAMEAPAGHPMKGQMWGIFVFQEIVAPERLVFVNSFADADGQPVRHPLAPTWPLRVYNTLTLTEEDGRTTLTLRGYPIDATEEEFQMFVGGIPSMQQGFAGTMGQLAEYLARA